jgi:hypothetical protein
MYHIHKGVQLKSELPTQGCLIGHSMSAPPPVIAQQYASAIFVSLRSHSRKKKFGAHSKNVIISFFK